MVGLSRFYDLIIVFFFSVVVVIWYFGTVCDGFLHMQIGWEAKTLENKKNAEK